MHNITLIGTTHSKNGLCNSDELYKIIEEIEPNVIFDELPSHFSDMYYSESFDTYCTNSIMLGRPMPIVPLEVKCVKKYKQNYSIEIIPVDIDNRQKLSEHQEAISSIFLKFFRNDDYKKLDNDIDILAAREGFQFLNSDHFLELLEKRECLEKTILESEIYKKRLLSIYNLFHLEQRENRENVMLNNIYNYSKANEYNQAILLIGANHRKSIMQKIGQYQKLSEIKLNWTIFGNK